jgi:hypothetical protein
LGAGAIRGFLGSHLGRHEPVGPVEIDVGEADVGLGLRDLGARLLDRGAEVIGPQLRDHYALPDSLLFLHPETDDGDGEIGADDPFPPFLRSNDEPPKLNAVNLWR